MLWPCADLVNDQSLGMGLYCDAPRSSTAAPAPPGDNIKYSSSDLCADVLQITLDMHQLQEIFWRSCGAEEASCMLSRSRLLLRLVHAQGVLQQVLACVAFFSAVGTSKPATQTTTWLRLTFFTQPASTCSVRAYRQLMMRTGSLLILSSPTCLW